MGDIVNDDDNECVDATAATWELLQVHQYTMSSFCLCRQKYMLHCDPVTPVCAG